MGSNNDKTHPGRQVTSVTKAAASFLLAAAFKEAPGLRWPGEEGRGAARKPGSSPPRCVTRSAFPLSLPGAVGARRGCDAAVVFIGSQAVVRRERERRPTEPGAPGGRRSPALPSLPLPSAALLA